MAVRKPCRSKGCKTSPRCEHPWWLDVMHNRERYRMPVDDFALARGATAPVTSKQEAEKVWEPKFIAEIVSGKDPRVPIERGTKFERTDDGGRPAEAVSNSLRRGRAAQEPRGHAESTER